MKKRTQLLSELPAFLRDCLEILFPGHAVRELLFFDIETTGLSAKTSSLYLIGACYYKEEKQAFELIQYFAEEYDEEPSLLKEFYCLSQKFSLLLHYNGRSFDLPYLNTKCEEFKMPFRFCQNYLEDYSLPEQRDKENFDIYQSFHKDNAFFNGRLFPLKNKKQKTMEILAGYIRKDMLSGKDLIQIYGDYRKEHRMRQEETENALLATILLHNHDDLCGLISICPLLGYSLLFAGKFPYFTLKSCQFLGSSDMDCFLSITMTTTFSFLPVPDLKLPGITIGLHDISLLIPGHFAELKFFFPDYKNYYYLPEEDMAVHKSVAAFVDKKRRRKAAPSTCYIKKCGYFFPQPAAQPIITPVFYQEYKDKTTWFEWTESLAEQKELLITYAMSYIAGLNGDFL